MPNGILPARYLRDSRVIDNRPPEDTEEFLRARVEAMDRRIKELEAENARLRAMVEPQPVGAIGKGGG